MGGVLIQKVMKPGIDFKELAITLKLMPTLLPPMLLTVMTEADYASADDANVYCN